MPMSTEKKKTPHRHHDPAFPAEARDLGERIASALVRIADAQECRALEQKSSNEVMLGIVTQAIPFAMSLFQKFADPDRAATPGPRRTEPTQ